MAITGECDGDPMKTGVAMSDILTAHHAFGAICAALVARERSGEGSSIEVSLFGGPTYFRVNQDVVGNVETNETFPYDVAQYAGATVSREHASHIGFNAGTDVALFFTRTLGVGGLVRFSQGTVQLPSPSGGTASVKVGGLQLGAGVRMKF